MGGDVVEVGVRKHVVGVGWGVGRFGVVAVLACADQIVRNDGEFGEQGLGQDAI